MKINLFDTCFAHQRKQGGAYSVVFNQEPRYIKYVHELLEWDGVTVLTNEFVQNIELVRSLKAKKKIAWLIENKGVYPKLYDNLEENSKHFDLVFSSSKAVCNSLSNAVWIPFGGCWIESPTLDHSKSQNISMILSNKRWATGHRLRFDIFNKYKKHIDGFGSGAYNFIKSKEEALSPYKFSICIENASDPGYFTEKIIDCFASCTIPVYWGDPDISDHFDMNGIFTLEDLDLLLKFGPDIYEERYQAVKNNFELAKQFYVTEDWIYERGYYNAENYSTS